MTAKNPLGMLQVSGYKHFFIILLTHIVDPYWSMDAAFMYIVLFLGLVFSLLFARLFAMTARHYE